MIHAPNDVSWTDDEGGIVDVHASHKRTGLLLRIDRDCESDAITRWHGSARVF